MFEGGPEAFWQTIYSSEVHSHQQVVEHLHILAPSELMCRELGAALGVASLSPEEFLHQFLQGSGIPVAEQFAQACDFFSPIVKPHLSRVDEAGFRPRMFTWAATGSTCLTDNMTITVRFH